MLDQFREFSWVQVNQGDTALFWFDKWKIGDSVLPLQNRFPRLFSYVKDPMVSVQDGLLCSELIAWFKLPLSEQAF